MTWRWIEGTKNGYWFDPWFSDGLAPAILDISDRNYFDLGFSWSFSDRYQVRTGIANLLDTDPPDMALQAHANNSDMGLYDVFGRSYYLTFSAHF